MEDFLATAGQLFGRDPKKWERLGEEKVIFGNDTHMHAHLSAS